MDCIPLIEVNFKRKGQLGVFLEKFLEKGPNFEVVTRPEGPRRFLALLWCCGMWIGRCITQSVIAAFLRSEEGEFEYGPALGALLFSAMAIAYGWVHYRAVTKGRIPFGFSGPYVYSKTY